jgi:methionine synthase II (cobalamin-independent)
MYIQYSEGLPILKISEEKRSLVISSTSDVESELVTFYDRYFTQDINYFSISRDYAPGLYTMLELIDQGAARDASYIKGQTIGPITFTAGITDLDGKPVLHNPELVEAMVRGLAIKALWQIRELGRSGKKAIIFLDEPYLSGFGSAYSAIQRHEVIDILQTFINYLRENSDALIGIHCCGNTDWSMIIEAGPDIVNFDAFEYMDYFLLYPDDLIRFVKEGGTVAWGIIPTSSFSGNESVEGLSSKLKEGFDRVHKWGMDPEMLAERSILTPACGMGTMNTEAAEQALALLSHLSEAFRNSNP